MESTARRRVVEQLQRLGSAGLDDEAVRREALAVVGRALAFDAWSWATSDPATHLAASALSDHPFERGMLDLLRAEEDPDEVNRRSALSRAHSPAAALGITTRGHPELSRRWREQLSAHGVADELRSDGHQPLPCAVLAATARAAEAPDDGTAVVRERCADGQWASVRAARLDTGGVAVTSEHSAPYEVLDYLARAVALTRREREVLALLFRGEDNRGIAIRLVIEPGTVQDHVKSILAKTGYPTRRALLASVVTTPAGH